MECIHNEFPKRCFFITYGNEHFIKKMIFIIHYSVHFLATPPSKISTGTKKQNAAYNDETYAVWRMETVFDLPSKKICVQLLENGWHLSSLEKPVGIHLKKDATLRDIYPF